MAHTEPAAAPSPGRALGLAALAWLLPGLGHVLLRRRGKALVFAGVVLVALITGAQLDGRLFVPVAGQPLSWLAFLASLGSGIGYFVLRILPGFEGDVVARGYEYGSAFLVTAGLMNWLLVLDVWDRAHGVMDRSSGETSTQAEAASPAPPEGKP